ncbi:hypothetical protein Ddye_005961 [Dipteronia dyeriana]|uniref:Uncharacterized protein n=1 Tax=Dipteronia dyeriana TaxID=168575 RepID=A0AAE0CQR1_9ROSI|nr:hypothetical protein Ddye_005961 [Dipteronia dyeriana]
MEIFWEALVFCDLEDMDFVGPCFTWSNKRDCGLIQERLDRGVCDFNWKNLFPSSIVEHLDFWHFDHRVVHVKVLEECGVQGTGWRRFRLLFHFEACWANDPECKWLVCDNWEDGNGCVDMVGMSSRLGRCAQRLAVWNQTNRWAIR